MSQAILIIGVVLAAIFIGVAIPALIQIRRTMRTAQEFIDVTGAKLNSMLDEASGTPQTIERVSDNLESITTHTRQFFEGLGGLGSSLGRVSHSVDRVGNAIGLVDNGVRKVPNVLNAVAAAVSAGLIAAVGGHKNERAGHKAGHTDGSEAPSFEGARRPVPGAPQW